MKKIPVSIRHHPNPMCVTFHAKSHGNILASDQLIVFTQSPEHWPADAYQPPTNTDKATELQAEIARKLLDCTETQTGTKNIAKVSFDMNGIHFKTLYGAARRTLPKVIRELSDYIEVVNLKKGRKSPRKNNNKTEL